MITGRDKAGMCVFATLLLIQYVTWSSYVKPSIAHLASFEVQSERLRKGKIKAARQYAKRRHQVEASCHDSAAAADDLERINNDEGRWTTHMWHSVEHRFSYCGMAKVGTTTWAKIFMKLAGKSTEQIQYVYTIPS